MSTTIAITVDAKAPGSPLDHFWSRVVGAGRANEGLRADWQRQLAEAKAVCGFEYIRFHGLFHDDMFVYTEREDGTPVYNFQYVDALFDALLDLGVKPFVEFGFSPRALARETSTVFWWGAHGAPPTDSTRWAELIERTVSHWVGRYGIAEVRGWYFEVWNEANLWAFFRGTRSEYFELYKVTVEAVKRVDAALRVGGPATSNFVPDARFVGEKEDFAAQVATSGGTDIDSLEWRPVWLEEFFDYCVLHELPVDFVSTHPYPTDWALDEHGQGEKLTREVNATPTDLALLRRMVDDGPFPEAEIHLTEWSSSSSPRDHTHDTVPAATFVVRTVLGSLGTVDSLSYWTFTDVFEEGGAGDELFHGGFGMITLPGIPKPTFHAFRMLDSLGDEVLSQNDGAIISRHSSDGRLSVLAFHYPDEQPKSVPASFDSREVADATTALGGACALEITITGVPAGEGFEIEILDPEHGSALAGWRQLGEPSDPTREQLAFIDRAARATVLEPVMADQDGVLTIRRTIEPWSVVAVRQITRY